MPSNGRWRRCSPCAWSWLLGLRQPARRRRRCSRPSRWRSATEWLTVGGDVSATFELRDVARRHVALHDDTGFFNYTDYEHSALRMLRVDVTAAVKAGDRALAARRGPQRERRTARPLRALRARPAVALARRSTSRSGACRRPSARSRGALSRRQPADRLSAGLSVPDLASPRRAAGQRRRTAADARARVAVELLGREPARRQRAAARQRVPLGHRRAGPRGQSTSSDATASVTTGTLANPLVGDDNAGRQVAGRVALRPVAGPDRRRVGRARTVRRRPTRCTCAGVNADAGSFTQTAWGADVEYSRDYYLRRFETIVSDWRLPLIDRPSTAAARARRSSKDATRFGRASTSRRASIISASAESSGLRRDDRWDAPVTRLEVGGGYSLQRNLLLKAAYQHNTRGRRTRQAPPTPGRRSSSSGSDHDEDAEGAEDAERREQAQRGAEVEVQTLRRGDNWTAALTVLALAAVTLSSAAYAPLRSAPLRSASVGSLSASSAGAAAGLDPRARRYRPASGGDRGGRRWRHSARRLTRGRTDRPRSVVYLETAPRGAFEQIEPGARGDGPAQRDVRAARARDHGRHDRRFPEQRPHLPQRVLALEGRARSISGRYAAGHSKSVRFDRPGIVRVFCDIHSHMNAFILVFSHPFFAMTDADGRYRIDNVPPGTYNVIAWNEGRVVGAAAGDRPGRRRRRARLRRFDEAFLSSLRSRIFLASALLAVLSIGAAIYLVNVRVTREAETALQREIVATGALVDQLRTTRAETFTQMARLIADAPQAQGGRRHQRSADGPGHRRATIRISSTRTCCSSPTGRAACSPRSARRRSAALVVASQPAVRDALAGPRELQPAAAARRHAAARDRADRRSASTQPDILGTLSVGFLLDDALAAQLKEITGSDVAFGMDGQILAATLPRGRSPGARPICCAARTASRNVTLGSRGVRGAAAAARVGRRRRDAGGRARSR